MQGNFISAIVRDALKTKLDELSDKKELNDLTIYIIFPKGDKVHIEILPSLISWLLRKMSTPVLQETKCNPQFYALDVCSAIPLISYFCASLT